MAAERPPADALTSVAGACAFLLSALATGLTGTTLTVDGGVVMVP
jgi:enoyl-[acyl-carrier-protein] reductase (NADH)